ncbi:MAG TPA: hypothetical protein VMK65_03470 [Longimicrobiales bacterium]|nr:hypothetical protein [Longimicrobiales bacterium]
MRIAFLVNDVATEFPTSASTLLAHTAARRGHDVFMLGVGALTYDEEGHVGGTAVRASSGSRTRDTFLKAVQAKDAPREAIRSDDLDVLWLRYNPSEEVGERAWAQDAGILLGQLAMRKGVLVLNHPETLAWALSKFYSEHFPAEARPRTLITRDLKRIQAFHKEVGGSLILKPLSGYGGAEVYLVKKDAVNLTQMVESMSRDGYVVCQEYLPEAPKGDTRLFLINGEPLWVEGKCCAVRRVNRGDDFRGNFSAGASAKAPQVTDQMLELARMLGPRLRADGIFFAGVDVVGEKIVEVNAISSGGLVAASKVQGVDFGPAVIEAVERKVEYRRHYGTALDNRTLATMP